MRQRTTHLFVVAVLGLAAAGVFATAEARQGQPVDPALKKAADALVAARLAGDVAAYARYVMDDADFASATGVLSKQERLAAMKRASNPKPPAFTVSDERYRTFGDTGIRTYLTEGTNPQGQNQTSRIIEVWVKQGGEWKLAAAQFTNLAKP